MADFSSVILIPRGDAFLEYWPPGDSNYPELVNNFITLNETLAIEIESAKEGANTLLDSIQEYVTYTLEQNVIAINPSTVKCKNMLYGSDPQDYVTLEQFTLTHAPFVITSLQPSDGVVGTGLNIPNSQLLVKAPLGIPGEFDNFDYRPSTLITDGPGLKFYPSEFNKTFYLDWATAGAIHVIRINKTQTPIVPRDGDRLRFIMRNCTSTDAIQESIVGIYGNTTLIQFGANYNTAIYDLVYAHGTSGKGWHFTNVILSN